MASSVFKNFLLTFLMPEKCYQHLCVDFHFHVPCLRFALKRVFGFWIILDTFLAQASQLLKILWRGSAAGLSLPSVLLQLYAFSCPVVFAVARNFPLFAWVERLVSLSQTAAIVLLILHHRRETRKGLLLLVGFGGLMFLLGSFAPAAIVSLMQTSSLAALIASKVLQALTNHCNGHTGQLSSVSLLLSCGGALGVTFVSLEDYGCSIESLSHLLSASVSCVLLAQVLLYGTNTTTDTKKTD